MRVLLLLTALFAGLAAPGSGARAAGEGLDLATITCATIQREDREPNPRMLAAAYAGRIAAKAGNARFAPDLVGAITDALRLGCTGEGTAGRKLADIIAGIAIPAVSEKDRDFATMTCAQLGLIWKDEARLILPFLVALRDVAADTPFSKAAVNKVGEGLPKLCREPANASRRVTELAETLK